MSNEDPLSKSLGNYDRRYLHGDRDSNFKLRSCSSDMSENYEEMHNRIRSASISIPAIYTSNPLSPKRTNCFILKNSVSPVTPTRNSSTSMYSPYRRPSSVSPLPPPKFPSSGIDQGDSYQIEFEKDPFALIHKQYMPVEQPSPSRKRSYSLGSMKNLSQHTLSRRTSISRISKVGSRARSKSVDLSSLSQSTEISTHNLAIQLNSRERKIVTFCGSTLQDLQTLINSSFLSLPFVHVCIEHPSIPDELVSIVSIDQLYDNAVIHLIPFSQPK